MKSYGHKNGWTSALSLLLALALALSLCGAAFASEEPPEAAADDLAELVVAAEAQSIHLEGVVNARQLGGYAAEDGRVVRANVLLRSGELTGATEEDIKRLAEDYHVTTIVDLRAIAEIEETPDPPIGDAQVIHVALRDESMAAALKNLMASGEQEDPDLAFIERIRAGWNPLNEDMYVDLIKTDAAAAGLREFVDLLLAQEDGCAILWHCSGGKDRTSVAAVVLLTLLGVDEETILRDFELTNVLMADEIDEKVEAARKYSDDENELFLVRATASAQRDFMVKALDYAKEQSGSLLDFIRERCGVTDEEIELLRDKYLVPDPAQEHSLHLEGVVNAWQLGGYETEDGRHVRDNVLMRSGNLKDATDEDIERLSEEYHLTTIIDFRSPGEINLKPDREVPGAENINISLEDSEGGGFEAFLAILAAASAEASGEGGASGEADAAEGGGSVRPIVGGAQPDMYTRMFVREATLTGFREFIDLLLAQDEDSVILYHCSSGKDRTGTATLILLTLLGVDKETILADFALTNVFLADEIERAVEEARQKTDDEEELRLVAADTGVSVAYMELAFDQAEEECGNMLDYVKQQFHVTDEEIARLRELYLTD